MRNWNTAGVWRGATLALLACLPALACEEKRPPPDVATSNSVAAPVTSAPTAAALQAVEQACTGICERSRVLKCQRADDCLLNCVGAATGTPCSPEFQSFYQCLGLQPIKNWECAEDGIAAIRVGFCEKEQERVLQCMETKAKL
jgi:hypothetical protein